MMSNKATSPSVTPTASRSIGLMSLLVLALIFIGIVLVNQNLFKSARLDLTNNDQFTLNAGSKSILKTIDEPINLYFFFTRKNTSRLPAYQAYATRVQELLEEMQQRSGGKLRLKVIDPQPFSEEEDQAVKYGISPIPIDANDKLIFGLAGTNATDGQAAIPNFDPRKEGLLEYDIMKMVQSLIKTDKTVIGVMSALPIAGGFDQASGQMSQPSAIYQQLQDRFEMRNLGASADTIASDISVVLLIHPKQFSEAAEYALDQFVLRGGRLIAFVDPLSQTDQSGADPSNPSAAAFANKSSDLPNLFKAWGVSYDPSLVAIDRKLGYEIPPTPTKGGFKTPVILIAGRDQLDQGDVSTAELETINIDTPGALSFKKAGMELSFQPLIQTTTDSQLIKSEGLQMMRPEDTDSLVDDFKSSNKQQVIAGLLSGKFKTAFPARAGADHLAEAKQPGSVMILADTDMATDRLWVNAQNAFGQVIYSAFADNGDLIYNAVDKMSGDMNLIGIRTRGKSKTSFTRVDALRAKAEEAFRGQEQALEQELKDTDARLQELQQAKSADKQMILSPEQERALLDFQSKRADVNQKLRQLRRGLDKDIEALGWNVKMIGTFLMPLALIGFAIYFFRARTKRRRLAAANA